MNVKVEWRSVSEDSGAPSVMTAGTQLMLRLSVDSLSLSQKVRECIMKRNWESLVTVIS